MNNNNINLLTKLKGNTEQETVEKIQAMSELLELIKKNPSLLDVVSVEGSNNNNSNNSNNDNNNNNDTNNNDSNDGIYGDLDISVITYDDVDDETMYLCEQKFTKRMKQYNNFVSASSNLITHANDWELREAYNNNNIGVIMKLFHNYNYFIKYYEIKFDAFQENYEEYTTMLEVYKRKFGKPFCLLEGLPSRVPSKIDKKEVIRLLERTGKVYKEYLEEYLYYNTELSINHERYKNSVKVNPLSLPFVKVAMGKFSSKDDYNVVIRYATNAPYSEREHYYSFETKDKMINFLHGMELIKQTESSTPLSELKKENENISLAIYSKYENKKKEKFIIL